LFSFWWISVIFVKEKPSDFSLRKCELRFTSEIFRFKCSEPMLLLEVVGMPELVVKIPKDLEFLTKVPEIELSLFVSRLLKEKLGRIERLEKGLQKSELTEQMAEELAKKISEGLAKRYIELYG